jgi:hypothetical protein
MPQAAFVARRVEQVRELRQAGASLAEIRATLGMSDTTLARLIREHGIPPANPDAAALRRGHRAYLRRS